MAQEQTFVMVKPDGVQRGLIGEILARFERKGLKLVAAKLVQVSQELAEAHYAEHRERPFFPELVRFITSAPVFAMILEGENAIAVVRGMMGKTNPAEAQPGTIRGDLALTIGMNVVHGSDSPESAKREMELWFPEGALSYERSLDAWLA
ncbi:nucleoside-diphosphate kinase [Alicyclobacillus vulcanalis]|uniref:Nucleoside diphosphate kinase n=1 Tax=Alicyclobacillus vulcanalis TaxID=252246 RepID=A0A1N7NCN6_9BACL|nr:nucleoside-diphosphate kinase [Alicyclobacillus vulcanalis]SIS96163.1 nucleoside diphosphate kinase [Alicyclobacillus vulcanalis]